MATAATTVVVAGVQDSEEFKRLATAAQGIAVLTNLLQVKIQASDEAAFSGWWSERTTRAREGNAAITVDEIQVLGFEHAMDFLKENFVLHGSKRMIVVGQYVGDAKLEEYEYDVIVIGGGSGGLACAKRCAQTYGRAVLMLDYVKPSPAGSKWGLGGTCVNVGCIPKKLMHQGALLGEALHDATKFGWAVAEAKHNWDAMRDAIQDYIKSLNFNYRVEMRDAGVTYKNSLGRLVDAHTVELKDRRGNTETATARNIIVAVGGRPRMLGIPGDEHCISSDDIFSLDHPPGKTLVVGASYVALECAGFLHGIGNEVVVMVRSILLRGFDQDMAEKIGAYMEATGIRFVRQTLPSSIVKTDDGRLKVTFADAAGKTGEEVFDTVLVAVGRDADTRALNLEAAGVQTDKSGKIVCKYEQTSVANIYAIGDVVSGCPELTPVAIAAGKLLADRLYGNSTHGMDYNLVPTTVFTPLEYGCCGLSEEAAIEKYGQDNIEVYHNKFTPLEWAICDHRQAKAPYCKLICNKLDSERVVGLHYLGPNAGEITQGFGAALRLGATFANIHDTVGIHPTTAEKFCTLTATKSSGASIEEDSC